MTEEEKRKKRLAETQNFLTSISYTGSDLLGTTPTPSYDPPTCEPSPDSTGCSDFGGGDSGGGGASSDF